MKQTALLILLLAHFSWSQNGEKHRFTNDEVKLVRMLAESEQKFDIKYSYADSVVSEKKVRLPNRKFTIGQLHSEIELQTQLTIVKIDSRYYSVSKKSSDTLKTEVLEEVIVEGFLSKGINKVNGKVIISPQKVEELPGVTDADVLLSLQQLPGVKSPNETATGIHVRGGTSDQNQILWDGIRMYHPGHLFGMISGFNPNIDQTIYYYNRGSNPKFGEKISSVIDIKTSDEIAEEIHGNAGINALNADFYIKAPLAKKKLGVQFAGRKSFTEYVQSAAFNALAEKVFQNTNFKNFDDVNRFQFQDYSLKLNYNPGKNSELSVTGIAIDNDLDFKSNDPAGIEQTQRMEILNYGFGLQWHQKYSSRFSHKSLFYYSAYTFDYENDKRPDINQFEIFEKHNRITDSGFELNFDYDATSDIKIEFGYQLIGNDISHSFTSTTQDLEINLDQKHFYSVTHAGFANATYLIESWKFEAGARYNYFAKLNSDSFEPRLLISKRLLRSLVWQSTFEKKSQVMSQVREGVANDLSLENYVWISSDGLQYPIQKGNQFTTGLSYKTRSWLFDADAYYKTIEGVTSRSFELIHQLDATMHNGEGFTKGLDFLIQRSAPSWRAWVTYTYQDSQNKYDGLNDGDYFPISSDITHAFTASFHKKWKQFSTAVGWFGHSGKPYSQLDASNEIAALNNRRLPFYQRFDLSGAYEFHNQKTWSGKAGISILNLLDRKVVISKEYQRNFASIGDIAQSGYTVQDYFSLGITPNIFVLVKF